MNMTFSGRAALETALSAPVKGYYEYCNSGQFERNRRGFLIATAATWVPSEVTGHEESETVEEER